jgi:hypothetical protein
MRYQHAAVTNIPDNPKEIWLEAIQLGSKNWIDEKGTKDNPGVWQRRPSKLTFDEAFDLIQPFSPHWVILFRDLDYLTGSKTESYWDFGGCNIGDNGYGEVFIWIQVKPQIAEQIFEKYKLQVKKY